MFPAFSNLALLAGLAGLAAPVLIHLLLRQRARRMRFSTVQFFVKRDETSARKRKLRNWLLLAVRMLLFAAIVLGFARPFLPNRAAAAAAQSRERAVLVLDLSASMQADGPAGIAFRRAQLQAQRILEAMQPGDLAALATSPKSADISFSPPQVLARKIGELQPGFASGDLSETLRDAVKLAGMAGQGTRTVVYVISDLQRTSAAHLTSVKVPRAISLKIIDSGERFAPNLAISSMQMDGRALSAGITSFSDESARIDFTLEADGARVSAGAVALDSGASTNIALKLPALDPGLHSIALKIKSPDALASDNARFGVMRMPEPVRGLVIEQRKPARRSLEESFFVRSALNSPAPAGTLFALTKGAAGELAGILGAPKPPEFVVLPGIRIIPGELGEALARFVRAGGGLLLFAGSDASANEYNSRFAEILPARLDKPETASESDSAWRLAMIEKSSPVFAAFREANSGNLLIPAFSRRFRLEPVAGSRVLARFDDGMPAVLERTVGSGRVLLINTSADTAWSDWPKHKTFLPWLQSAAAFVAGDRGRETSGLLASFDSGSNTDLETPAKRQKLEIELPDGSRRAAVSDESGLLRDVAFDTPGIYRVFDSAGKELRRVAVNLPAPESDLSNLTPAEFEQQIARTSEPAAGAWTAGFFGNSANGKELWKFLLLTALALMIFEPLLANKTAA